MSRAAVLIFGEDSTDTAALKILTKAVLPEYDVLVRREPIVLSRNAARRKRGAVADRIAAFSRAESGRPKTIIVTHRDCDAVDPAHIDESTALEADLTQAGVENPVAACPAWEMETWWMLYPEALCAVRGCWRAVNYGPHNVGMIANAKERLTRDLRPTGVGAHRCPDYTESDSVRIAEEIVTIDSGLTRRNRSRSLQRFYDRLLLAAQN